MCFYLSSFSLVWQHFDTDTQDLTGIEWAPNGCVLAAWDSCLEYKVLLYSLDGRLLSAYCAYEWSLGIKSVAWSPSSQFLAIGSYDGKVRLLNHVTWKMITEFGHPAAINNPKADVSRALSWLPSLQVASGRSEHPGWQSWSPPPRSSPVLRYHALYRLCAKRNPQNAFVVTLSIGSQR
ncbi:hypothetical protein NN561_004123 [Cricetulus griseus]